jgi:hypothetical protein
LANPTKTPDPSDPANDDAEKLADLKRELQMGLDDLAAGRVNDGDAVFARLRTRFRNA